MNEIMANKILALVKERGHVSFVELDREIEGFTGGEHALESLRPKHSNIIIWVNLTEEGSATIRALLEQELIHTTTCSSLLVYMVDGGFLKMPIARRARHYKEPHWLPSVINPGPHKARRSCRS